MSLNARIERRWAVATTHTVVWPAGPLDPARLARACADVAGSVDPRSFVARRVADAAAEQGLPAGEYLLRCPDRFVTEVECRSLPELLDRAADDGRGTLPFTVLLCRRGFALSHSHELGDGSIGAALLDAVLQTYRDGDVRLPVPTRVARDRDLVAALAGVWRRRPAAVTGALRGVVRRYRRRPAPAPLSSTLRPAGAVRVEPVLVPAEEIAAMDRWRRSLPSAPSSSMTLLRIVARALERAGHPTGMRQTWQVVVGLRPSSPRLAGTGGNLIGRALVDVDTAAGPAGTTAQLRRQSESGELLVLHLVKLARELAGRVLARLRRAGGDAGGDVGRSPGLSWSDRGRHTHGGGVLSALPASGGNPASYTFVTPFQDGIGVNVNWLGDAAALVLTFGSSTLDDAAVDAVVSALGSGAADLLDTGAT